MWLIPIALIIINIRNNTKILRGAFIAVLLCYFVSSGLFFIRNHGGVTVSHVESNGHTLVEYCDIDPGAMGSVHCRRAEYFSIIESKTLSVRILKSVRVFNGRYSDLGG